MAGKFNNEFGTKKSLAFFVRHIWVMAVLLILSLISKQFRMPNKKETHFICLAGVLNLFLNLQLFAKNTTLFTIPYLILWIPVFPSFILIALILLKLDKWSIRKAIGATFLLLSCGGCVIYSNITSERSFYMDSFMIAQILVPPVGALSLKLAIIKRNVGIFNLGFWVSLVAFICALLNYILIHHWNAMSPFFSICHQLKFFDIAMIFFARIIIDVFNTACFAPDPSQGIYLASKKQLMKAAVFVTLDAVFLVIFNALALKYSGWIYGYILRP
ncbi:unnamed protein product [Moneuplotes crassus]|uniref:Uncharacterized protein n=1 Tax=Euplotes crassus TaxID=5936 RepID=A0AAD1XDF4_EUPCR|nr:unnamed protein product [Moneuplotes crassus]